MSNIQIRFNHTIFCKQDHLSLLFSLNVYFLCFLNILMYLYVFYVVAKDKCQLCVDDKVVLYCNSTAENLCDGCCPAGVLCRLCAVSLAVEQTTACRKLLTSQGRGRYLLRLALSRKVLQDFIKHLLHTPRIIEVWLCSLLSISVDQKQNQTQFICQIQCTGVCLCENGTETYQHLPEFYSMYRHGAMTVTMKVLTDSA